jgi:hypothetical protein
MRGNARASANSLASTPKYDMKARVVIAFGNFVVGNVFDPPAMLFDDLKRRQWVEGVPEDTPVCLGPMPRVEQVASEAPVKHKKRKIV